jgi:hypothetical protein
VSDQHHIDYAYSLGFFILASLHGHIITAITRSCQHINIDLHSMNTGLL